MPESVRPRVDPRSLLLQNLALLVSAGLIAYTLLHVIFVARFRIDEALTLLQVTDQSRLLLASALTIGQLSFIWVMVQPVVVRRLFLAPFQSGGWVADGLLLGLVGAPIAVLSLLVLPVLSIAFVVALLIFTFRLGDVVAESAARSIVASGDRAEAALRPGRPQRFVKNVRRSVALLSMAIGMCIWVSLIFPALLTPWVARESVVTERGRLEPAYVYGSQDDQMLIGYRGVLRFVPADMVKTRELCAERRYWWDWRLSDIGPPPFGQYRQCIDEW